MAINGNFHAFRTPGKSGLLPYRFMIRPSFHKTRNRIVYASHESFHRLRRILNGRLWLDFYFLNKKVLNIRERR